MAVFLITACIFLFIYLYEANYLHIDFTPLTRNVLNILYEDYKGISDLFQTYLSHSTLADIT